MKLHILLLALALASAQINQRCTTNETCYNKASPCTNTNCICDPLTLTCRLALGLECRQGTNYCQTGTTCSGGRCLALDGQHCEDGLCIEGGDCILGVCRATPGLAWDPVKQIYSPCDPICDTCLSPGNPLSCLTCADSDKLAIGGACVCIEGAANNNGVCLPCDPSCLTCAVPGSPFGCTSCSNDLMTLISGICFCPEGMAWNNRTLTCDYCDLSCLTCSIPKDPTACTSCAIGTLINGNCTTEDQTPIDCPDGSAHNDQGVCQSCHYSCQTCLVPNNPNRCTSCTRDKRLVGGMCVPFEVKYKKYKRPPSKCPHLMASINGVCKCIRGYVGDSLTASTSDTYCLPCDYSCLTCYESNNPNACTSCYRGMYLHNGRCSLSLFPQPPTLQCSPVCLNCTRANDPHQCTSCAMTNSLQRNGLCYCPAGNYNFSKTCVEPCDYPCLECFINDSSICTACPTNLLPLGGTCLCPNGTALASEGECASCHVSCATCIEPDNPNACSSCVDPRATLVNGMCLCPDTLMIYNNEGLCECPEGLREINGVCIFQLCPPGTVLVNDQCVPCNIPNCVQCSSLTNCTECAAGYYLLNGRCIRCPTECLTCSSGTTCTSCNVGYTLVNGKCMRECPSCCTSCTYSPTGNPICTSCINSFVYINGICASCSDGISHCINCRNCACTRCRPGYYLHNATSCLSCESAIPNCEICNGPNICLKCSDGYQYEASVRACVLQTTPPNPEPEPEPGDCPEGLYKNKLGMCVTCYFNCKTCIGGGMNMCTSCYPNSILYPEVGVTWGRCVCRGGYWFDKSQRSCVSTAATTSKPKRA